MCIECKKLIENYYNHHKIHGGPKILRDINSFNDKKERFFLCIPEDMDIMELRKNNG